ncbi:TolC family protein [Mangrovibacterium marinum]|uniref:TolC family protein n=1 Tax=Mangrovibacterium marinum TaxID=1639118 RepID=UPI002A18CF2F|nr:TolC family protein [Mangrovibacterium marinum]
MKRLFLAALILLGSLVASAQTILTLEQSKSFALKNNASIKNSSLELRAAKEIKKEAYTNFFPKVSASALGMQAIDPIYQFTMLGGNLPVFDGNIANLSTANEFAYMPDSKIGAINQLTLGYLNVLQPIYIGGKIKTGNKLASLNIDVKERQQKLSENEVLMKTEQQYWLVVSLQEKQKALECYIEFLNKLHDQVKNAYKNGLILKNDLLKVSIKQSELQVNRLELENGKKLALMQLCQTIGVEYNADIILDDDLNSFSSPEAYFVLSEDILSNRTEYQLLEKAVEASKLQTKMEKGEYMPTIALGAAGYRYDEYGDQHGHSNGLVYASLSIPISDWWSGKHKMKEMKGREEIARNTLKNSGELLNLQIEKAWTDLSESYKKIGLAKQVLEQTKENLDVNKNSYDNGTIQLADLLEARALNAEAENRLVDIESLYKLALTNYLQVTGR